MTEEEAILLLASYNLWRLGAEIEMKEPKEITEAIETIINAYYKKTNQ
jgi:hypothetical protein